jgi:hypothetical protein
MSKAMKLSKIYLSKKSKSDKIISFKFPFIKIFLTSYWSAGFETFLAALALASYWLENIAGCMPMPTTWKNDQYNITHY